VPFARLEPWERGLGMVGEAGFETIALTPDPAAEDIRQFKHEPNTRLALVLGAEGPGLSEAALAGASRRVRIPMAPGADSLNVATSLAVALSHLCPG
ncbi:MAG: TrmH family RNA methyltransferase, partial [Phycisphaerales bacterium JB041]